MTSKDELIEQEEKKKNDRMKYLILACAFIMFAIGIVLLVQKPASNPKLDTFANCLADKGAKFYGAWWCTHCNDQKKAFGTSFKILEDRKVYIECANKDQSTTQECLDAGIEGFPTWIFEGNQTIYGFATFPSLQEKTGCTYQ